MKTDDAGFAELREQEEELLAMATVKADHEWRYPERFLWIFWQLGGLTLFKTYAERLPLVRHRVRAILDTRAEYVFERCKHCDDRITNHLPDGKCTFQSTYWK